MSRNAGDAADGDRIKRFYQEIYQAGGLRHVRKTHQVREIRLNYITRRPR